MARLGEVVRAGKVDELRLALALVDEAASLAESSGADKTTISNIRRLAGKIRKGT